MIIQEKRVQSYLTKSKISDYAINHYVGCPYACRYCYACFMKRFTNHPEPWGTFLDVKRCDRPLDLKKIAGKGVFMSTVTDCYNPYERKYRVTRSILEQLLPSDCTLQIATKSKLILRDVDILKRMKNLRVALSLNTLSDDFQRDMDRASSVGERIRTLEYLNREGIYTVLFLSPIFIGITDWQAILDATKDFVCEYWFEDLQLRGSYRGRILRYIEEKYPHLSSLYRSIYLDGDKRFIQALEMDICAYCRERGIPYSNFFHHQT